MNFVNKTKTALRKEFFDKFSERTFCYLVDEGDYDFDLIVVSEKEIRALNEKYRNKDEITDVLSFELKKNLFLGQIFICLSYVQEQALKNNKKNDQELAEVFIHGLLHLLGYDDKTKKGFEEMVRIQKEILKNKKCQ